MAVNLKRCEECGRMFSPDKGETVCSKCLSNDERDLKNIKEYVRDHPDATVPEISDRIKIGEDKILQFMDDGRLNLDDEEELGHCSKCGKLIKSGRFCTDCASDMASNLKNAFLESDNLDEAIKKTGRGFHTKQKK